MISGIANLFGSCMNQTHKEALKFEVNHFSSPTQVKSQMMEIGTYVADSAEKMVQISLTPLSHIRIWGYKEVVDLQPKKLRSSSLGMALVRIQNDPTTTPEEKQRSLKNGIWQLLWRVSMSIERELAALVVENMRKSYKVDPHPESNPSSHSNWTPPCFENVKDSQNFQK